MLASFETVGLLMKMMTEYLSVVSPLNKNDHNSAVCSAPVSFFYTLGADILSSTEIPRKKSKFYFYLYKNVLRPDKW